MKREYSMTASVTALLNNLEWNLLSKRRQFSRLSLFFKFLATPKPTCYQNSTTYLSSTLTHYSPHTHHLHYISPTISTTYFQKSFFPRPITDRNNLPDNIIENDTLDHFTLSLKSHDYNWHSGMDPTNILTLQLDFLLLN